MISLQRRADHKHIHWSPVESNKTGMYGIAPVLIRKRDNSPLKITHCVIVAEAQRGFFADLPDGCEREVIIDDKAAGKELKSAKLEIERGLGIEQVARPAGRDTCLAGNSPIQVKVTHNS